MILNKEGSFGILNIGDHQRLPFIMLDGGIESRFNEVYDFHNNNREDYKGYLLQYTLSGEGILEKDGKNYFMEKNHGFFIKFPQNSRYYLPSGGTSPWKFFYLHFDGSGVNSFWEKVEKQNQGVFMLHNENEFISAFLNLHTKLIDGGHLLNYEGGEIVYHLLCLLMRGIEQPGEKHKIPFIQKAREIMEREYATLISLEELAIRLEVTPSHLARTYREQMGISPIQDLTKIRVQSGINDLLNTTLNVEEIALNNGFSNGNYFSKVFRKHMNCSPLEYRKTRRYIN